MEWIKRLPVEQYRDEVKAIFAGKGVDIVDDRYFEQVLSLVKDRCTLLPDFWEHSFFFFKSPKEIDFTPILAKWNDARKQFFYGFIKSLRSVSDWKAASLETVFKQLTEVAAIKPGELQLPMRLMLVGGKFGPPVFEIAEVLGKEETITRIEYALEQIPA